MSLSKPTPQDPPVDGYLSYAIALNMKVGGTLGNEDSIVVGGRIIIIIRSSCGEKSTAVPFGLLALDKHAHLNVLAYLQPNWVQWGGGGGRERERKRSREG
jgi:hypothetical protein